MAQRSPNPLIWIAIAAAVFLFLRHNDIGRQAPEFTLQGAYGGDYHLDSFRGRPVLLVFWTTSCGICRHELPILDGLYGEAARNGVEIACVNIGDVEGAREVMRPLHLLNLVDHERQHWARLQEVSTRTVVPSSGWGAHSISKSDPSGSFSRRDRQTLM